MVVNYSRSKKRSYLIFASVYTLFVFFRVFCFESAFTWVSYAMAAVCIAYWVLFFLVRKVYFSISDTEITLYSVIPPKRIAISEITKVRYFAGAYTFASATKDLVVDERCFDKEDLQKFKEFLSTPTSAFAGKLSF